MRIALIGIATLFCLMLAGCGGSGQSDIATRSSTEMGGKDTSCSEHGPEEVAGEREMLYTCACRLPNQTHMVCGVVCRQRPDRTDHHACMAIVEDAVYIVRMEKC